MRILKTTWFTRFADKEGIDDESLRAVVNQLEKGQFDANLGAGLYKQRLARPGAGKSAGYRVLICFHQGERSFFVYGFPKSARGNIKKDEERDFKKMAKILLALTERELEQEICAGVFLEIPGEE